MEESKRKVSSTNKEDEAGLDVSTMLKDFSDKLNQNLVADPWEDSE